MKLEVEGDKRTKIDNPFSLEIRKTVFEYKLRRTIVTLRKFWRQPPWRTSKGMRKLDDFTLWLQTLLETSVSP